MELLFISCITPKGRFRECSFGGPDLESCFDALNSLVKEGWQLVSVELKSHPGNSIWLPVEAFDGEPITPSIAVLQQEWEEVLQLR